MSFDDLLGGEEDPVRNKGGRPKGRLNKPKPETDAHRDDLHLKMTQVHNVTKGVSTTWLEQAFRIPRYKIGIALQECPVLRTAQNGGKIYDLPTAARYLIDPVTNLDAFLATIKPDKLPEKLRETYWNAKIKEAKYRVMAGELWPTESVMEVFAETFKTIKKVTQLWVDTVEETNGLSDEQRDLLATLVDRLQDDIYKALVSQAKSSETESFLKELSDAAD
ncbi:DUF1441 family protein [Mesorhizobium sp. B2-8-9]|uniref:DUF1441 family protein n=1 Tax=Mesorhizobium sp. B2-8-9 TaxID=2589899 RepID=UPI00112C8B2D|nr:DUF1441 family protein [Mesorhizobium sp. B2-8-9]TPI86351.1 DUF1441 family protein [Mesorhizobium sp. B2-8-9]